LVGHLTAGCTAHSPSLAANLGIVNEIAGGAGGTGQYHGSRIGSSNGRPIDVAHFRHSVQKRWRAL